MIGLLLTVRNGHHCINHYKQYSTRINFFLEIVFLSETRIEHYSETLVWRWRFPLQLGIVLVSLFHCFECKQWYTPCMFLTGEESCIILYILITYYQYKVYFHLFSHRITFWNLKSVPLHFKILLQNVSSTIRYDKHMISHIKQKFQT